MKKLGAVAVVAMLSGCMNMPTPPEQISGAYTSGLRYENYDCGRLSAELESLGRREQSLIAAQKSRIESSKVQAFWMGWGQGDGMEASQLATVRGEAEAVRSAMSWKKCGAS